FGHEEGPRGSMRAAPRDFSPATSSPVPPATAGVVRNSIAAMPVMCRIIRRLLCKSGGPPPRIRFLHYEPAELPVQPISGTRSAAVQSHRLVHCQPRIDVAELTRVPVYPNSGEFGYSSNQS